MISKIIPSHCRTLGLSFLPNFLYCCTYVISCETVFLSQHTHDIATNIMSYIMFTFGIKLLTPQVIKCRSSTTLHFVSDHHTLDCTHPLLSNKQANESNCSWPAHCMNCLAPGTLLSFSAMYNSLYYIICKISFQHRKLLHVKPYSCLRQVSHTYFPDTWYITHCKKINVNLTFSLLFWMQVSEQITHMDSDNYHSGMRMRRKNQTERGKVSYEIPLCK